MGSHPVAYDFFGYLDEARAARGRDPLLEAWLDRHNVGPRHRDWLDSVGHHVHSELAAIADFVERAENRPRLLGKGPFDNNPQQVVLPAETWEALEWVHTSGLWDPELPEAARYAAVYLLNQNGEMGVTCSVACTDGLVRVLRRHGEDARSQAVLRRLEKAGSGDWSHGAQFVTEIQGGSDAGQNAVVARREGEDTWSLWGQKWFCSNLTADHWLITARPENAPTGPKGVGLFLVPRDQAGYTVERLKDKLGTRALPTAEIVFRGAQGWPVGPLEKGLSSMVSDVLVTSRVHNVIAAAAFLRTAQREAQAYAGFREAFGIKLEEMPLVGATLDRLAHQADRAQAGAFATVDHWLLARASDDAETRLWSRVLVGLAKAVSTRRTPKLLYRAMMVLGGNGIEERFSPLPRLWRDAAILETWEGPYTLLLMNALQDLVRGGVQGREKEFLEPWLGGSDLGAQAADGLKQVLEDPEDLRALHVWPSVAHKIHAAWEERALAGLAPDGP